jgi:fibro-slime domain-containing protein
MRVTTARSPLPVLLGAGVSFFSFACSAPPPGPGDLASVGGNGGIGASGGRLGSGGTSGGTNGIPVPFGGAGGVAGGGGASGACSGDDCAVGCGNGKIDPGLDEACDDANASSGDGCAADCSAVERDHGCLEPGLPCVNLVKCGDGKRMGTETCDDGNATPADGCSEGCTLEDGWDCSQAGVACVPRCGDARLVGGEQCDPPNVGAGCNAACRLEPGYACDPPPSSSMGLNPAACHRTVCGDAVVEGIEACDDGNDVDGDGCSGACTLEPECAAGTCTSNCGDGIKLAPEGCDDGNAVGGDGCSASCALEVGFSCDDASSIPAEQLKLAVTYRDFVSFPAGMGTRHADFESDWEGGDVTTGLVEATLDADGLPVAEGRCSDEQPASFADALVCPYGQMLTTSASFATWYRDVPAVNLSIPGSLVLTRDAGGSYTFDAGNAGFYPIDATGFTVAPAREETYAADAVVNDGLLHDFGFTTEIHYFFQYLGGEALRFSGDDDLWIFVNRRLALDVGGLHPRTTRTLDLDQNAAALGLTVGGLYEIALFHAERHSAGSNFQLTLTGFAPAHSTCAPTCGDGVVAASEACDLGEAMNTGGYNGCTSDCRRGPSCGDGVVQAPDEACDDGLNVTPYSREDEGACAPGCVPSGRCGDGTLDSLFGEECDTGGSTNDTACSPDCRLGPRCGDGMIQRDLGEECDDGNTVSGDSCSRTCRLIVR